MSKYIVDPKEATSEKCAICLNALNKEQVYELPECGHKYHTNCIFHWIRSGNINCPYCGNNGVNASNECNWGYSYNHTTYKDLRQLSRKKDAPKKLKQQINKLKKIEQKLRDCIKENKEFKNKIGKFSEMKKQQRIILKKKYTLTKQIRKHKKIISKSYNISSLILIKKKNIT